MKRYASVFGLLVLLALILTACSGSTNDNPGQGGSSGNKVTPDSAAAASANATPNPSQGVVVRGGVTSGPIPTTLPAGVTTFAATTGPATPPPVVTGAIDDTQIVPYAGLIPFTPSDDFKKPFESQFEEGFKKAGNTAISNFRFNYYYTSEEPTRITTYYDGATGKVGYGRAGQSELDPMQVNGSTLAGRAAVYTKDPTKPGGSVYQLTVLGPLDQSTAKLFGKGPQARDTVVIISQGTVSAS